MSIHRTSFESLKGALLGILVILLIFFTLGYFHIIDFSVFLPIPVTPKTISQQKQSVQQQVIEPSPTQAQAVIPVVDCTSDPKTNPLLHDMQDITLTDGAKQRVGSIFANVQHITSNLATKQSTLQLVSPKGDQTQSFAITDQQDLVSGPANAIVPLSSIPVGHTVSISFMCFQNDTSLHVTKIYEAK